MQADRPGAAPAPLKVAASLVALEALVMLLLAGAELLATSSDLLLLGLTTTLFFLLYGGLLLVSSVLVTRGVSWTRGPILIAQLIQLGLAWSLLDYEYPAVPVALVITAVITLAGMLHPATLRFLLDDPEPPAPVG